MASPVPVTVCDPHFHVWDTVATPNPNLGGAGVSHPVYPMAAFLRDAGALRIDSGVHVETVVGQMEGGAPVDTLRETEYVLAQAAEFVPGGDVRIVPFVHLGRRDAAAVIDKHIALAGDAVVGVRMILSWDDSDPALCWPQVAHGLYLSGKDEAFNEGFALLAPRGLSFDLHVNWHQLRAAAAFLARYPDTDVIVDHLGCPRLGGPAEAAALAEWRSGIRALAANPRVSMKASGLASVHGAWLRDAGAAAAVRSLVREVIEVFGVRRVLFASNFPVDGSLTGASLAGTYAGLYGLVSDLPLEDLQLLFHDNARRVYKMSPRTPP